MKVEAVHEKEINATVHHARAVLLSDQAEQRWINEAGSRGAVRCTPGNWQAADEWMRTALASQEIRDRCAAWAAHLLRCDTATVLSVAAPLQPHFAEHLFASVTAALVLPHPANHRAAMLCSEVLGWKRPASLRPMERWAALAELVPSGLVPRLVMDARFDLAEGIEEGDFVASYGIEAGLRLDPDQWRTFLGSDAWERCATRWRLAPVLGDETPASAAERFLRDQAPSALPLFAAASAVIPPASDEPVAVEKARSTAEALLFAVLDARPLTRARFQLNTPLPFTFGLRPAEADLAAVDARLVVEIDGYYHFRDAEAYRRDRRKDALLQEHGWFVLRFLAEDIVSDLERVVTEVESLLARRDARFS